MTETAEQTKARVRAMAQLGALFGQRAFRCPHCSAYSQHGWYRLLGKHFSEFNAALALEPLNIAGFGTTTDFVCQIGGITASQCAACQGICIWRAGRCVDPVDRPAVPPPSTDMPADVKADYEEAADVLARSPRAAAALLRLAVEKLCRNLGKSGDINKMIASLVQDGLPKRVQQALDTVRVIGNEAVHPGSIDLRDDPETATTLFQLVAFIVDRMITEERKIDALYQALPAGKRDGIEARDNTAPKPVSSAAKPTTA